jgi:hypothetical protein
MCLHDLYNFVYWELVRNNKKSGAESTLKNELFRTVKSEGVSEKPYEYES